jgi:ribonuclease HI
MTHNSDRHETPQERYEREMREQGYSTPPYDYDPNERPPRKEVMIYTDGSCIGNPGPGGWAAILYTLYKSASGTVKRAKKTVFGNVVTETTNQRMELLATLRALEQLTESCVVHIYTDSEYVCNIVSGSWIPKANMDIVEKIYEHDGLHEIKMHIVRGHSGNEHNDLAHDKAFEMATQAKEFGHGINSGYERDFDS